MMAAGVVRSLPWPEGARRAVRALRAARAARDLRRLQARLAGPQILEAFAERYPAAFFVEIGANDGEQHDHLRPIIASRPWRGIMVEPVPYVFARLHDNYGGFANIVLENSAIADRDGELPFYHLRQAEDPAAHGLPRWYDGIGSFSKEAVIGHAGLLPDLENRLTCISVPSITFSSLCRKHGVEHVDLLLVDTEGYDHEILRSIDWDSHRPRLVVYEHYHLSGMDRRQLRHDLVSLGYELKEEGFDTWCLRDEGDALSARFRELVPAVPAASAQNDR
jgi:FkbM family methyltransferase